MKIAADFYCFEKLGLSFVPVPVTVSTCMINLGTLKIPDFVVL